MRALVTGAGGFIGCALTRRLLDSGDEVHVVVRPGSSSWRVGALSRASIHRGDLVDAAWTASVIQRVQPDVVFHCAAHGAYSFERDIDAIVTTNVLGTLNVLRAMSAGGCTLMVNSGSSSEYGDIDHAPAEDEPARPNSVYAASKAAATWLGTMAERELGVRVVTLRLYSVYGPFEDPRRLMPTLCAHARRGLWPPLAEPWVVRDYIYIDDVVDAYVLASTASVARIYNVGSGTECSLRDLVETARRVFGVTAEPRFGAYPNRDWDVRCWRADPSAIASELGWAPSVGLEDGLRRFADWMGEQPEVYALSV
jgi:nucleoside-diphosphate-sugar epimerase